MTGAADAPAVRRVLVLNGPNLGRLGKREPSVYGAATYADLSALCVRAGRELGLDVEVRQTEYEGELVTWIHEACDNATPVVLNAGALTHYSYALMDAVKMRTAPLIEVHISNIAAREGFRHESVITGAATGIIAGLGFEGYVLALSAIASELDKRDAPRGPLTVRPMAAPAA
ncbi:MAG TPA: type II 3-dehydroquinate dehydratase, partial [Trebonia sp.]